MPTAMISTPEPNAVQRQPHVSSASTVIGTSSPPMAKPTWEIPSAVDRLRSNQFTIETVIAIGPPSEEPTAMMKNVR